MKRLSSGLVLVFLITFSHGVYAEIPGAIHVTSDPTGAAVFLDEKMVGRTPVTLENLTPGRARLRIELRGYRTWEEWVLVEAGRSLRVERTLEQRVGTVVIRSNAPKPEVLFRDRWIPATEITLSPGTYALRFRAFGYTSRRETVTVFQDRVTIIDVKLEKATLSAPAVSVLQERFHPHSPGVEGRARFRIEVDAPSTMHVRVLDPEGNPVYESEENLVQRVTRWEWDGSARDDRVHEEGRYRIRFLVYDEVSRYIITHSIVLDANAIVLPRLVSAYGWGTTLLTIPEIPESTTFILDLGGGIRVGRQRTVPITLGIGVAPFPRLFVSGTVTIPGDPDNTPPVVGISGGVLYTLPVAAKHAQPAIRIGGAGATGSISGRERTAVEVAVPVRLGVRGGFLGVLAEIGVGAYDEDTTPENPGYHISLGLVRERPSYLLSAGMRYVDPGTVKRGNVRYAGDIVARPTSSPVFFRVTLEPSVVASVLTFSMIITH